VSHCHLNGDGDIDIVMGSSIMFPSKDEARNACLTVLENRLKSNSRHSKLRNDLSVCAEFA
jgi:hypothetical protein